MHLAGYEGSASSVMQIQEKRAKHPHGDAVLQPALFLSWKNQSFAPLMNPILFAKS